MTVVRFTPRAEADAVRIDTWWRSNRPSSPDLFARELAEATRELSTMPGLGVLYVVSTLKNPVRRLFLHKSRCHVYFFYDSATDRIEVLAVWSALRKHGPKF